jgi:hypothetical protein
LTTSHPLSFFQREEVGGEFFSKFALSINRHGPTGGQILQPEDPDIAFFDRHQHHPGVVHAGFVGYAAFEHP